jgi:signal transduction histidine kinase
VLRNRGGAGTHGFVTRRPVRLRFTLIYSGCFLLAGAVLLGVSYALVAGVLPASASPDQISKAEQSVGSTGNLAALCKASARSPSLTVRCKQEATASAQRIANVAVLAGRASTLDSLLRDSLAGLGAMAALAALLGWVMAGRALRPVHAITAAARRASQENLSERIALDGPDDELKELADTFDAMLARLEAAFTSQRRFVANASHELRTPLTVMRTAIDVTLAKPERSPAQLEAMAAEVRHATDQAERLVEALLTLARSDRGSGPRSELDLAVLAEDALDAAAPAIKISSLRVTSELAPGPAVGDPVLVERLVANLIDNAVRHNVPDGWLAVTSGSLDGTAFVSVANGGPVIPDPDVPSLFEPFRRYPRPDATTPDGVGLGLSIVQSVVTAHRGHVTARPGSEGGLEVTVTLPSN